MSEIALDIDSVAAGGDGVGRLDDGRVAFVPRTAPGDRARIAIVREHARFVRGRLLALERAGPGRIDPKCDHYDADRCGGCQLQHLDAATQRAARRTIVGDALRRIGGLEVPDPPLEPALADWGYRAKITVARGRGRRFGFHPLDEPRDCFALRRCEVADPTLSRAWEALRPVTGMLPSKAERLVLRLDQEGRVHLVVEDATAAAWSRAAEIERVVREAGVELVVWWRPAGGAPRVLAGRADAYAPTAFRQVNPAMGELVRRAALDALGDPSGRQVWDLYAGVGETSSGLLARGARVVSVERDARAVALAQTAGGDPIDRRVGEVEAVLDSLPTPDLVVTNPPRAGMARPVVERLRDSAAERVVYVSCDPATLARDLALLTRGGSFRLIRVASFDLFPQTAHVESVALVERA
ncbi:MAG: class I SAM-dependent RNA methyltransferase [Gemmatimonadales bacterium]